MQEKKKRIPRVQQGYFHVILRSNFQVNVFEDCAEVDTFLQMFGKYAKIYSTRLLGYVIMTTHVHLIMYSEQLSKFMQTWLKHFSEYRNKKNRTAGKIFLSPFTSYLITSQKNLIESIFYMYYNPLAENICKHPREYRLCSYSYHYPDNRRDSGLYSRVCSEYIRSVYKTRADFDNAFFEYVKLKRENKKRVSENGRMTDKPLNIVDRSGKLVTPPIYLGDGYHPYTNRQFITDTQVLEFRNKHLKGRDMQDLSLDEIDEIICLFLRNTSANRRQIASVMMVSYEHVRKVEASLSQ
ncbi:MAG: transposase [Bacteroidales bacterium]